MKFMYFNLNQITTLRNRKFSRIPMVRFKSTLWIPAYRHNVSGVEIIRKKMCKFLLSNENYAFLFSQTAQTCSQSNPKLNEMNKQKNINRKLCNIYTGIKLSPFLPLLLSAPFHAHVSSKFKLKRIQKSTSNE